MAFACSGTQGRVAESGESVNFGASRDRPHRGSKTGSAADLVGVHTALRALRNIPYMYHQMEH